MVTFEVVEQEMERVSRRFLFVCLYYCCILTHFVYMYLYVASTRVNERAFCTFCVV